MVLSSNQLLFLNYFCLAFKWCEPCSVNLFIVECVYSHRVFFDALCKTSEIHHVDGAITQRAVRLPLRREIDANTVDFKSVYLWGCLEEVRSPKSMFVLFY